MRQPAPLSRCAVRRPALFSCSADNLLRLTVAVIHPVQVQRPPQKTPQQPMFVFRPPAHLPLLFQRVRSAARSEYEPGFEYPIVISRQLGHAQTPAPPPIELELDARVNRKPDTAHQPPAAHSIRRRYRLSAAQIRCSGTRRHE